MVHLIENYYALTNNMGFTLAVDKGKTDKEGNKIYDTIGYQRLQNGSYELSEALAVIENVKEEIKAAITNESNQ